MKRTALNLILTLAALTAPAAFGMHYSVSSTPTLTRVPNVSIQLENNVSTCTAASNTIAVGVDIDSSGYRILCADAARIGFWTTPVAGAVVGHLSDSTTRYLCPSGSALAGLQFIEGLIYPFPLCGELVPDFQTGLVSRKVLFNVNENVVAKESKTAPEDPGVFSCGPAGWVQSLTASRNAAGAVSGFGGSCNTIVTAPANIEDVNVDLAVRTVFQPAVMGRDASDTFRVDVFNLGNAAIPASNVTVELRFDFNAWQLLPFANTSCTDIVAHRGVVDRIFVGKRCTIPGSVLQGKGGVAQINFMIQPFGSDASRPATTTPQSIVTAKVSLIDENLEGADPNASNDLAAFPVELR
jgi:hypothetical protein